MERSLMCEAQESSFSLAQNQTSTIGTYRHIGIYWSVHVFFLMMWHYKEAS